jgi:hypothetical protein
LAEAALALLMEADETFDFYGEDWERVEVILNEGGE